jgi:hypothetical protein
MASYPTEKSSNSSTEEKGRPQVYDTYAEGPGDDVIDVHRDGDLQRGLKARQISMIAVRTLLILLPGTLNSRSLSQLVGRRRRNWVSSLTFHTSKINIDIFRSLIIGSGTALVRGGPLGLFLGYRCVIHN